MRIFAALGAYIRSLWLQRRLGNREKISAYHARQLKRLSQHLSSQIPFYASYDKADFHSFPIIDKATLLENFDQLNVPGIALKPVTSSISENIFEISDYKIGHSTGTSGNRGYYIISDKERFIWLGTILAKALPKALWARHRVALILPGMSSLYNAARDGSRVDIRFFDLSLGLASWEDELSAFSPDTLVAPPKILRYLAEAGTLGAQHIFSGAEVLDPVDKAIIEDRTGHIVRQIYMATEGLFGVSCPYGTLHLAEDVIHFEWEPVAGSHLVSLIVTDFTRRTQAMARYRLNDLLELSDKPCACGSAFQAVSRIEGRADDIFHLPDETGQLRLVTPDVLRNTLIDVDARIQDFRIIQTRRAHIEIRLKEDLVVPLSEPVKRAFLALFQTLNLAQIDIAVTGGLVMPEKHKLRRVRREWAVTA